MAKAGDTAATVASQHVSVSPATVQWMLLRLKSWPLQRLMWEALPWIMKSNASCTLVQFGWMLTGPTSPPRIVRSLNSLQDLTVEGWKDIKRTMGMWSNQNFPEHHGTCFNISTLPRGTCFAAWLQISSAFPTYISRAWPKFPCFVCPTGRSAAMWGDSWCSPEATKTPRFHSRPKMYHNVTYWYLLWFGCSGNCFLGAVKSVFDLVSRSMHPWKRLSCISIQIAQLFLLEALFRQAKVAVVLRANGCPWQHRNGSRCYVVLRTWLRA